MSFMGLLNFFKKKEANSASAKKEKPFTGSWNANALSDDQTQAKRVANKRYHVVQKGESLSTIAKKYYGNEDEWRLIYHANQDNIKDPEKINPDQRLYIPKIQK